jgi:hypothetical protein
MTTPTETNKFDPTKIELTNHPLADIFPLMEGPEFDALVEDIKINWLTEPITLFEDKILDGRNRHRAIVKAGQQYKVKEENFRPYVGSDPLAFVISANLHRRHLTESQRALIATSLVTTKLGFNQYNKSGVSTAQAAKLLGVSEATVKIAKDVEKKATPEIKAKVQKGELRLGMAKDVIKKSKDEQQAELDRIIADVAKAKANKQAARAAGAKANVSAANQAMTDLDNFKKKWQSFNEMQRRGFVMSFKDDLASLLEYVRQQEAMVGPTSQAAQLNLATL